MLKSLATLSGISSYETEVVDYILNEVKEHCDKVEKDIMGNLFCFKKGKKQDKTIMFAAHTDEVGFLITNITEDGFLKFLWMIFFIMSL